MASLAIGRFKVFVERNCNRLTPFLKQQSVVLNPARNNHMFSYLSGEKDHDSKYMYERTKDPKEWECVERLMPLVTVPVPKPKDSYPSGWRPPSDDAHKHPYYIERSVNHLLPVYLNNYQRGWRKVTKLSRIHGDIWKLHDELKEYLKKESPRPVVTSVQEGNNKILFKGDCVYYIEQWLLSKGF